MVQFCTEKNHNKEAPNLQNQKCNLRSTWEVIQDSEDFKKTTPMTTKPPNPTFSLLQIGQRIVCLVLDKSGSMSVCSVSPCLLDVGLTLAGITIWPKLGQEGNKQNFKGQNSYNTNFDTRNAHLNFIQQKFTIVSHLPN